MKLTQFCSSNLQYKLGSRETSKQILSSQRMPQQDEFINSTRKTSTPTFAGKNNKKSAYEMIMQSFHEQTLLDDINSDNETQSNSSGSSVDDTFENIFENAICTPPVIEQCHVKDTKAIKDAEHKKAVDEARLALNASHSKDSAQRKFNEAIEKSDLDAVKIYLEAGVDVSYSLLYVKDVDCAKLLLSAGTDINKNSPIFKAIEQRNPQLVKYYLSLKPNMDINSYWGNPLASAIKEVFNDDPRYKTREDLEKSMEIVKALINNGHSTKQDLGQALVKSIDYHKNNYSYELVKLLVTAGADINKYYQTSPNSRKETPLLAASNHRFDTAKYLLAQGADPNLCTDEGLSPLHEVVRCCVSPRTTGGLEMVTALLNAGANVNRVHKHTDYDPDAGHIRPEKMLHLETPLDKTICKSPFPSQKWSGYGHPEVIQKLRNAGAKFHKELSN